MIKLRDEKIIQIEIELLLMKISDHLQEHIWSIYLKNWNDKEWLDINLIFFLNLNNKTAADNKSVFNIVYIKTIKPKCIS